MTEWWKKVTVPILPILPEPDNEVTVTALRDHTHTGRNLGGGGFITTLEEQLGRILRPKLPGRPKKKPAKAQKWG